MEIWKAKIGFFDRLKFAWKAFWLQPFSKTYPFAVGNGKLNTRFFACDIGGMGEDRGCTENALHCVSRPTIVFGISTEEHFHICDGHFKNQSWIDDLEYEPSVFIS